MNGARWVFIDVSFPDLPTRLGILPIELLPIVYHPAAWYASAALAWSVPSGPSYSDSL